MSEIKKKVGVKKTDGDGDHKTRIFRREQKNANSPGADDAAVR